MLYKNGIKVRNPVSLMLNIAPTLSMDDTGLCKVVFGLYRNGCGLYNSVVKLCKTSAEFSKTTADLCKNALKLYRISRRSDTVDDGACPP